MFSKILRASKRVEHALMVRVSLERSLQDLSTSIFTTEPCSTRFGALKILENMFVSHLCTCDIHRHCASGGIGETSLKGCGEWD